MAAGSMDVGIPYNAQDVLNSAITRLVAVENSQVRMNGEIAGAINAIEDNHRKMNDKFASYLDKLTTEATPAATPTSPPGD